MNSTGAEKASAFKLSTGESVNLAEVENQIANICHYVRYAIVKSDDGDQTYALIFPDKNQLDHPDYKVSPEEGCYCPRSVEELGKCLHGCLAKVANGNQGLNLKCAAIVEPVKSPGVKRSEGEQDKLLLGKIKQMYAGIIPQDTEAYIIKL